MRDLATPILGCTMHIKVREQSRVELCKICTVNVPATSTHSKRKLPTFHHVTSEVAHNFFIFVLVKVDDR